MDGVEEQEVFEVVEALDRWSTVGPQVTGGCGELHVERRLVGGEEQSLVDQFGGEGLEVAAGVVELHTVPGRDGRDRILA